MTDDEDIMEGGSTKEPPKRSFRDSALHQSFRKAKEELSKQQHLLVVALRLLVAALFAIGVSWAWRDRYEIDPERNPVSVTHVAWTMMFAIVLSQLQYGIAHLVAVFVPDETPIKSRKLTLYILESMVGLSLCGPVGSVLYSTWQLTPGRYDGVYADNVEALATVYAHTADPDLRRLLSNYAITFNLLVVLYLAEMAALVGEMRPELQVHHVLSISFFVVYLVSEISTPVSIISFTQLFFAYAEFPLFTALAHYRLTVRGSVVTDTPIHIWNRNRILFSTMRFYWAISRVAMTTLVVICIVWQYEYLTAFQRAYYITALAVQVVTLGLTQREIHGIHAKLAKNHAAAVTFAENGRAPSMRSNTLAEARRSMMSVRNVTQT